jgi:hypothetical protein
MHHFPRGYLTQGWKSKDGLIHLGPILSAHRIPPLSTFLLPGVTLQSLELGQVKDRVPSGILRSCHLGHSATGRGGFQRGFKMISNCLPEIHIQQSPWPGLVPLTLLVVLGSRTMKDRPHLALPKALECPSTASVISACFVYASTLPLTSSILHYVLSRF